MTSKQSRHAFYFFLGSFSFLATVMLVQTGMGVLLMGHYVQGMILVALEFFAFSATGSVLIRYLEDVEAYRTISTFLALLVYFFAMAGVFLPLVIVPFSLTILGWAAGFGLIHAILILILHRVVVDVVSTKAW